MNLNIKDISYIIIPKGVSGDFKSLLYSLNYNIIPISAYQNSMMSESAIGYGTFGDAELIKDSMILMEQLNLDRIFIKFKSDESPTQFNRSGERIPMEIQYFPTEPSAVAYVHNGFTFSLNIATQYVMVSEKNQLKKGDRIEILNNNNWVSRIVEDVDSEWSNVYSLFSKYRKIRLVK